LALVVLLKQMEMIPFLVLSHQQKAVMGQALAAAVLRAVQAVGVVIRELVVLAQPIKAMQVVMDITATHF
jgi:hypothetical protein